MRTWLVVCLLMLPAVAAGQDAVAEAQTPDPLQEPTARRHLGFFFRGDVGLGYFRTSAGGRTLSSVGLPLGVAVGGAVTENLILAAEAWGAGGPGPSESSVVHTIESVVALGALGLNVTYYLMPANVYFSVTPALTVLRLQGSSNDFQTTAGFGAKASVGKEWWVGDHWGLGIAFEFTFAVNRQTGIDPPTWTSIGGGLTFSATYN